MSEGETSDHFTDVGKTIKMPKTAEKTVPDIRKEKFPKSISRITGQSEKLPAE